jgi:hypothetical protein
MAWLQRATGPTQGVGRRPTLMPSTRTAYAQVAQQSNPNGLVAYDKGASQAGRLGESGYGTIGSALAFDHDSLGSD